MALVPDQRFSTFQNGGDLDVGDIVVGLRGGLNTKFNYTGELPPSIVIPISNGGTGATTAGQARINLGLGTIATQDANTVAITGGTVAGVAITGGTAAGVAITASTAALTAGSVVAAPSAGTDITNKTYVDSLVGGSVASVSGTLNRITSTGGVNPVIDISASYVGQASITTLGTIVTGVWNATVIDLAHGGSNANLTASLGGIVYSTATAMAILAGTPTAGRIILSGATAAPSWSTTTYPATNAINTIMYASAANVLGVITAANSAVLITSSGGVPSLGTTLPNINIGTPTAGVLTNTTGGGGLRSFQVLTTGTGATYTKPANVTSILVEVLGAGGGGGSAVTTGTNVGAAGGGGSGGYARLWVAAAAATYTYTIGAGGAGGGAGASATGTTGGTTTFSASSLAATGGNGGAGSAGVATTAAQTILGGLPGVGSGGTFNCAGAPGAAGITTLGVKIAGNGGVSYFAGNGRGGTTDATGASANSQGGGGAGGASSGAAGFAGGTGGNGLIIVWEFS